MEFCWAVTTYQKMAAVATLTHMCTVVNHTTANIDKVKVLALILLKAALTR